MSGHTVAWTITNGGYIDVTFTCDEPEGAPCREYCQGMCEDGVIECDTCEGYGHPPVEDRHCARCLTPIVPVRCLFVEWATRASDGIDMYDGPKHPMVDGPIECEWTGDWYQWRYIDAAADDDGQADGNGD